MTSRVAGIAVLALALLAAAGVLAQDDRGRPPVAAPILPGLPGRGAAAAPPAPVPPDTVTAPVVLLGPGGSARSLAVVPDTVTFGGVAWLVAESGGTAADSLGLPDWLEPAADAGSPPSAAAAAPGRLAVPVRVYRVDPFRVREGGAVSGVVTVRSRGTDGSQTAPVRAPRLRGWRVLLIAALVLAALALLLLARMVWRRRRGPRPHPADRPVPGAAWPRTATALAGLLDELDARGDARVFLDRLATLTRAYAADRFGIAGREMTGREIVAACRRLGHGPEAGRPFARLLEALDERRYAPGPVPGGWCRDRASELLAAVAAVRIAPGPTAMPAAELRAGESAWARLVGDLGRGGGAAA